MKIAVLTLPYDHNYGGNLQRYALIMMLQKMGHDVTHINLRFRYTLPWYKKTITYGKRFVSKYIFRRNVLIKAEKRTQEKYLRLCEITDPFYEKFIPHTERIYNRGDLKKLTNYDAFIVGSDQVWRKCIAASNLPAFFFVHLRNIEKPKIAFAVSFGTDTNELSEDELTFYGNFYRRFTAVSVREKSGLELLQQYKWEKPKPIHLLDPAFLLNKGHYQKIIKTSETKQSEGNLFCYILDSTEEKELIIKDMAEEKKLKPFWIRLNDNVSIQQWLRSFDEADYVITDSFHGLVFSLIFNKSFNLLRNKFRGNTRFDSVLQTFDIKNDNSDGISWDVVNSVIASYREKAQSFLNDSLV